MKLLWGPVLPGLAVFGLWKRRDRWRELLPLLGVAAAFLAPTVLLHMEGRYLLPASLIWTLLAAACFSPVPGAPASGGRAAA